MQDNTLDQELRILGFKIIGSLLRGSKPEIRDCVPDIEVRHFFVVVK